MSLFVPILAFSCVLTLMIWFLLAPSSLLNLLQSAIPPEVRSAPPRYPHLSVIVIFATGVGFFYELESQGVIHSPRPPDVLQFWGLVVGACFFAANGIWACYWPVSFQRRYIPQLRRIRRDALTREAEQKLEVSGKCWGIAFLLLCSYLVHIIGVATL